MASTDIKARIINHLRLAEADSWSSIVQRIVTEVGCSPSWVEDAMKSLYETRQIARCNDGSTPTRGIPAGRGEGKYGDFNTVRFRLT